MQAKFALSAITRGSLRRARGLLLCVFLLSLYLPWAINFHSTGNHFDYWVESGVAAVAIGAVFTEGLLVLPILLCLVFFAVSLLLPRSRVLAWICRMLLVAGLAVVIWVLLRGERTEIRRHLPMWQIGLSRSGLGLALLALGAAIYLELRTLIQRESVKTVPERPDPSKPPASIRTGLRRAALASTAAIPAGLVLLFVAGTAGEMFVVSPLQRSGRIALSWELHFYFTAGIVILGMSAFYVRAILNAQDAGHEHSDAEGALAASVRSHAVAQLAAGMSFVLVGAPLTHVGAPLVPPQLGVYVAAALWIAAFVFAFAPRNQLPHCSRLRFGAGLVLLSCVGYPLLTHGVVRSAMDVQLLIAGTGWTVLQILSLTHWMRYRFDQAGRSPLAAMPPALCLVVVLIGLTVLHGVLAVENIHF